MFDGRYFDQIAAGHRFGDAIIVSHITLLVLTTLTLVARFMAKMNTKARWGLDDVFILLAQALFYACAIANLRGAYLVKQVTDDADPRWKESTLLVYISGTMYAPTVVATSVSILLFYRSAFPVEEVKKIVDMSLGCQAATCIAGTAVQTFVCRPMTAAMYFPRGGPDMTKCINYPAFFIAILTIELLGDIGILGLPIWQVSKLKLDSNTKWQLSVVFLLGGISVISGILRIQQSLVPDYWFIDLYGDIFWIAIHEATAIIAASLPICRPVVRVLINSISSASQKIYSFSSYMSKYPYKSYASGSGSTGSERHGSSATAQYYKSKELGSTPSEHSRKDLVSHDLGLDTIDHELMRMEKRPVKPVEITVHRTYEVV